MNFPADPSKTNWHNKTYALVGVKISRLPAGICMLCLLTYK